MKTITLSILDSEEDAVMRQIEEWRRRQVVRFEAIDPLIFPGDPLTPAEWAAELQRAEASGFISGEEAKKRLGL